MQNKKDNTSNDKEPNFILYRNWESTLPEFSEPAVNDPRRFYNADF